MKTPAGKVTFCPSCPNSGDYLGPIVQPSRRLDENGIFVSAASRGGNKIAIQDADGALTVPVAFDSPQERVESLPESRQAFVARQIEQKTYDRIGQCVAGTVCAPKSCPAFDEQILRIIANKLAQE